jgi:hypothetical protein
VEQTAGKTGRRSRLALAGLVLTFAVAVSIAGAQEPPIYQIPTPTPTPTPTPAPTFQSGGPQTPPPQPPSGPSLMRPFPVVRTAGFYTRTRTGFTRFTVKGPVGARVRAQCTKHRCRLRRTLATTRTVHLKPLQKSYPPRTTIQLRISAPNVIGKYVGIRTRRGKPPTRRDRCLRPGSSTPVDCG